jgi:hypothetical protein
MTMRWPRRGQNCEVSVLRLLPFQVVETKNPHRSSVHRRYPAHLRMGVIAEIGAMCYLESPHWPAAPPITSTLLSRHFSVSSRRGRGKDRRMFASQSTRCERQRVVLRQRPSTSHGKPLPRDRTSSSCAATSPHGIRTCPHPRRGGRRWTWRGCSSRCIRSPPRTLC